MHNFKHDLFISYAHIDDEPDPGWVTELRDQLSRSLRQRSGIRGLVKMWHDQNLDKTESVRKQLIDAVKNSAIFVAILSPGYIKSKWCNKEVIEFLNESIKQERANLPIVLVEIYNIDRKNRPEALRDREAIKFWVIDKEADGVDLPIGYPILKNLDSQEKLKFMKHVASLALTIFRKIETLKEQESDGALKNGSPVADISSDDDGGLEIGIAVKVFINAEPSNLDLAKQVKEILKGKGQMAFLPSDVGTQEAAKELRKNYENCKAAVIVSPDYDMDWLFPQLMQLNKAAAQRRHPLEFLWIVNQTSDDTPPWLVKYLDTKLRFVTKKRIVSIHELQC
ncbi:toll/interleukin-1 receptor domain-containing protein [Candidatus Babeliales bacterium]|nr:toll/interleukin-1 receptor domain-containing protein [Candidatus Babeliales bacterium]